VEGVLTTAATATIIFLAGDLTNWSATVVERRRLAGVLVSLFMGATAVGLLLVHAHIYAPVLPFVITVLPVATGVDRFAGEDNRCEFDSESVWADRAILIIC
jgi:cytochrome c oxidase subunit IV